MAIEYQDDKKVAICNGNRFVKDNKTGYYLSSKPIDGKRKRLHIYVWESVHGEVPEGFQIHHIDRDKGNNEPNNLAALPKHNHLSYHSKKESEKPESKKRFERVQAAAAEWHGSEAGHEWHKQHYEEMKESLYQPRTYKCLVCGKEFVSTKAGSKFCCNAHKTAYRYQSGVDNEERICAWCGKPFTVKKYLKTVTCSRHCTMKYNWSKKKGELS